MHKWATETLEKFISKYERTAALAATQDIIPYAGSAAKWDGPPYEGDAWWTNGFWPGLMWQLFAATQQEVFRSEALRVEERLVKELCVFERLHHDVGFMYMLSCGGNWMDSGSRDAKRNLLHAANILAGRFNLAGGFIRAWNEDKAGWAIIDSMMNVHLLFWASRETKDPRFAQIAVRHADTAMRAFVREDGSCNHIVIFDPDTGEVLQKPAGQGYAEGLQLEPRAGVGIVRLYPELHKYGAHAAFGYRVQDCGILHQQYPPRWDDGLRFPATCRRRAYR